MAVNATRPQPTPAANSLAHAMAAETGVGRPGSSLAPGAARKASGYGLPCAKCRLYYPADLDSCPICHHTARATAAPRLPIREAQAAPDPIPDSAAVEQEREEFLRQFKSQLLEAHAEATNPAESICMLEEHDASEPTGAEICKPCYERVQERLDVCEAALHMDLKEAAQIVYDAVWADSSDPGKTYQNAANALLSELRKRAGVNSLLGPFHPLSH